MKNTTCHGGCSYLLLVLFTLIGLSSCAVQTREPLAHETDLTWPAGNEIPRIRYSGTISRPEDLGITKNVLQRLWGYIIGAEEQNIVTPFGVTLDDEGRIYVVDAFWRNIHLFDTVGGNVKIFPDDEIALSSPIDIAVDDENGRIFVTDSHDGVVKVFEGPDDQMPLVVGGELLNRPTGIAIHHLTGELLVVDTKLCSVLRFDLENLNFKGRFGSRGMAEGEFNNPTHICVAGDGSILITDALNFRVQIFSADGEFLRTFGSAGDAPGYFSRPRGIATDSDDNIYVVDALFDNIQIFDIAGRLLMAFGSSGRDNREFWLPAGISIDKNDRIYVTDSYNKRIQVFQYLKQDHSL
ncbi:6-bladed beta-propeller [Desulfosediminicola flagellatus]|uniref:6-bladed beta-propeller n=1 Tax=Desulfosediminicola flagellatus TaxID=2569541 RepID=UPI0010ACE104|nr:6-bladed beta-propeller [Desulfosediminicola flagellatus]